MCGLSITKLLDHPDPITYEPKTDIGRRLQKNAKWLYFNGARYWNGYKNAVPKYDLAVLFSSFLMGEIAAATIFKQMYENSREPVFKEAFKMADNVLYMGVRGVTDLMVAPGLVNLDFADIRAVMAEMGKAMMGTGEADGENRAIRAAEAAISNPLLEDTSMAGARGLL
ncbi:MAG: hypothetical protein J0I30_09780, partial [Burkholderiales bacterium]|nr:hypothetical protein [Burkholderiales bacterium]